MHSYRVVDRWEEENRLALRCSAGQYHLARALKSLPQAGAKLDGDRPQLGFGILQCAQSGALFRVIFESVGDTAVSAVQQSWSRPPHRPQGNGGSVLGAIDY